MKAALQPGFKDNKGEAEQQLPFGWKLRLSAQIVAPLAQEFADQMSGFRKNQRSRDYVYCTTDTASPQDEKRLEQQTKRLIALWDSCASRHVFGDICAFVNTRQLEKPVSVSTGDVGQTTAEIEGDVQLYDPDTKLYYLFEDVLFIDNFQGINILSLPQLARQGHSVVCKFGQVTSQGQVNAALNYDGAELRLHQWRGMYASKLVSLADPAFVTTTRRQWQRQERDGDQDHDATDPAEDNTDLQSPLQEVADATEEEHQQNAAPVANQEQPQPQATVSRRRRPTTTSRARLEPASKVARTTQEQRFAEVHDATHASPDHLRWMIKHCQGMPENNIGNFVVECESCSACKARNKRHSNKLDTVKVEPNEVWTADFSHGYHHPGPRGETVTLHFTDKGGRRRDAHPLVRRQQAVEALRVQLQIQGKPKIIQVDRGTELVGSRFQEECIQRGIRLIAVPTEEHELQGLAESTIASTRKLAATLMHASGAEQQAPEMWVYAMVYATHIHYFTGKNRLHDATPHEVYTGNKPQVSKLKPFGCMAWVRYLEKHRTKSQPTARRCVFLGLNRELNAYLFYDWEAKHVCESRDATFVTDKFPLLDPHLQEQIGTIPRTSAARQRPQQQYLVNNIIDHRKKPWGWEFKAEWDGWDHPTWELASTVRQTPQIRQYLEQHPEVPYDPDADSDDDGGDDDAPAAAQRARPSANGASDPPPKRARTSAPASDSATTQGGSNETSQQPPPRPTRSGRVAPRSQRLTYDSSGSQAGASYAAYVGDRQARTFKQVLQGSPLDPKIPLELQGEELHLEEEHVDTNEERIFKAVADVAHDPKTFKDVCELPARQKNLWFQSIKREHDANVNRGVFRLIREEDIPPGVKPINSMLVFKTKRDGTMKSRWVAKGYAQAKDPENYAPVAYSATVRVLVTVAQTLGLIMNSTDVDNAFLQADIREKNIVVKVPHGFHHLGDYKGYYMLLLRALYGCRGSSAYFAQLLAQVLRILGFIQSKLDSCLWWKQINNKPFFVCHHVDDLLTAGAPGAHDKFIEEIGRYLEVTSRGEVDDHVGIQFTKTPQGSFIIHQEAYAKELVRTYGMNKAKGAPTPMTEGTTLEAGELVESTRVNPQEFCGQLGWLCLTRPDLRFAATQLSRYQTKPTAEFYRTVKRVLKYLNRNPNLGLPVRKAANTKMNLQVFCDASWAPGNDRKSITGVLVLLNGTPIDWMSKRQTCIACSSGDAEIFALSKAVELGLQHRQLLEEMLSFKFNSPLPVFTDSTVARQFAINAQGVKRSRAIDIRFHHVRDNVKRGEVEVKHVPTTDQLADVLTKAPSKEQFWRLVSVFMQPLSDYAKDEAAAAA